MEIATNYEAKLLKLYPDKIITNFPSTELCYMMWRELGSIKEVRTHIKKLKFKFVREVFQCISIGIHKSGERYTAVSHTSKSNSKFRVIGTFDEELESALAFNVYNILNNINTELNKIPLTLHEQIALYNYVLLNKYGTLIGETHTKRKIYYNTENTRNLTSAYK